MRAKGAVWILAMALSSEIKAESRSMAFDLEKLPSGKSVTIPRPATTLVPLWMPTRLTATDMPQSLSLKLVPAAGGQGTVSKPVKILIQDPNSDRVVSILLRPGVAFVYNFRDLRSISVEAAGASIEGFSLTKLQLESNKPLEISR